MPALDRLVIKSNNNKLPVIGAGEEKKHYNYADHRSLEGMLRIEGRSHLRDDYEHEEKRLIERDIKAELRKIYNLKSSPKKMGVRRRV